MDHCNYRISKSRLCPKPIYDKETKLCRVHYMKLLLLKERVQENDDDTEEETVPTTTSNSSALTTTSTPTNEDITLPTGLFTMFIPLGPLSNYQNSQLILLNNNDAEDAIQARKALGGPEEEEDDDDYIMEEVKPKKPPAPKVSILLPKSIEECTTVDEVKTYFLKASFKDTTFIKTICTKAQNLHITKVEVIKAIAEKIEELRNMGENGSDASKLRKQLKLLVRMPFEKKVNDIIRQISQSDYDTISNYLHNAKAEMDKVVYGLNPVKEEILSFIAQKITNPNSQMTPIALAGPRGIGKTSLALSLKNILNLPFKSINLGGKGDTAFLNGHQYCYVGSNPGIISKCLMEVGSSNCILYFDELDKVSGGGGEDSKSDMFNSLIHLIDQTSNSEFYDLYFGEVPIDLSDVFFIFSFNDEAQVDPILLDRIRVFHLNAPSLKEKIEICRQYLIPNILKSFKSKEALLSKVYWSDDVIQWLIERVSIEDVGVRSVKAVLEMFYLRLNVLLYLGLNSKTALSFTITEELYRNILSPETSLIHITIKHLDTIIGKYLETEYGKGHNFSMNMMYA